MVADVEVFEPLERTKLTAHVAEIGANGCYVRVPTPFQPKTVIQVHILRGQQSFKSWGRVVHSQEGRGMGIAFFRPEPYQEKILRGWIAELKVQHSDHEAE
jgi:hypothetical protein